MLEFPRVSTTSIMGNEIGPKDTVHMIGAGVRAGLLRPRSAGGAWPWPLQSDDAVRIRGEEREATLRHQSSFLPSSLILTSFGSKRAMTSTRSVCCSMTLRMSL